MPLINEKVYLGRDNTIDLELLEDEGAIGDHTDIARVVLVFGQGETSLSPAPYLEIDSLDEPALFDFTDSTKLILKLGAASIPKGRHTVRLVIYLSGLTNGATWEPQLQMTVI